MTYLVHTKLGYSFRVNEPLVVGKVVPIPTLEMDESELKSVPPNVLGFVAQKFGRRENWSTAPLKEYSWDGGLETLPEYIMTLPMEQLVEFLTNMYSAGGKIYLHYIEKSMEGSVSPESRFLVSGEAVGIQIQQLWWRLGIRVGVYKNPQLGWMVQTMSTAAFVSVVPFMERTFDPKVLSMLKKVESRANLHKHSKDDPMTDRVISMELIEDE